MKKYIKPTIHIIISNIGLLTGSAIVSAPDMEYSCGCTCLNCKNNIHHPQQGSCDYLDDLNDPFW